ncbi:urease accessory protein UreD [Mesorhizobium sp.]|uniref:urease accessory protein UreD n=1 Tax=Mesorhizobium sp. TaxID=1871066 RepID=UPI000FE4B98C|nr:MAG: urease accessory protein UreD [Mesorhizobium sp.]
MNMIASECPPPQLSLDVGTDASGQSRVVRRHVSWPWSLPRGFHLHGPRGPLTVLPQAAAAALLSGDRWRQEISVSRDGQLRLIEAGATLVHAGPHGPSSLRWQLFVADDCTLALFARPFVLTAGAMLRHEIQLCLSQSGTAIICEGVCLRDTHPDPGISWQSQLTVERPDRSLVLRDAQLADGAGLLRLDRLCRPARAFGSIMVLAPARRLELLRQDLPDGAFGCGGGYAAIGAVRGDTGLALRLVCADGGALSRILADVQVRIDRWLFH